MMRDTLNKEMKNENIMLLIGIILFAILTYYRGVSWAISTLVSIFLAVTLYDWIKKRIDTMEKG